MIVSLMNMIVLMIFNSRHLGVRYIFLSREYNALIVNNIQPYARVWIA
jgi:hypothetical protein